MFDVIISLWPLWFVILEIFILLGLYKFYISGLNVQTWENKARETGFLTELLEPVILEVSTLVSASVLETIETKYRQSMGVLTRVSKGDVKTELEGGLSLAESILKSMGWKNPNILLVSRLASTLANVVGTDTTQSESTDLSDVPAYLTEESLY